MDRQGMRRFSYPTKCEEDANASKIMLEPNSKVTRTLNKFDMDAKIATVLIYKKVKQKKNLTKSFMLCAI